LVGRPFPEGAVFPRSHYNPGIVYSTPDRTSVRDRGRLPSSVPGQHEGVVRNNYIKSKTDNKKKQNGNLLFPHEFQSPPSSNVKGRKEQPRNNFSSASDDYVFK
jgi:hypothetical protein